MTYRTDAHTFPCGDAAEAAGANNPHFPLHYPTEEEIGWLLDRGPELLIEVVKELAA
jgi:hypothetical protein